MPIPGKKGLTAKQKEKKEDNKLNYLKNDLNLWHRKTCHILDTSKELGNKGNGLAKEIVGRLITRRLIKREDLYEIVDNDDIFDTVRPCSGSRQNTPRSITPKRRRSRLPRNIGEASPQLQLDKQSSDDVRRKLDLHPNIEYGGDYVYENSKAENAHLVDRKHHQSIANVQEIGEELIDLQNENKRLRERLQKELDKEENPDLLIRLKEENKFLIEELQKEMENKTVLSCNQCETLMFHLKRYKSERDESKTKTENLCKAVKCLRDRNDRLLVELDQYKEEFCKSDELKENQIISLQNTMACKDEILIELENRINVDGKKTITDFAERLRDANAAALQYENQAETYRKRCEKGKQKIHLLKNEKEELENILQKINVENQRAQKDTQWFEQQRKELTDENRDLQMKILQLENMAQKDTQWFEQQRKELTDENRDLQMKILQLENIYAAEQEKCKNFEKELQSIATVLRETDAEKNDLVNRIQELQISLRSIQGPDEKSLMTIEYQKIELDMKNKELTELKRKMHSLEKEIPVISNKRLSDTEKENVSLCNELTVTLKSLKKSEEDLKKLELELENEKARNSKMLSDQRKEMDSLNHDKLNVKKQLDHVLQKLINLKKQETEKKETPQEDINRLEEQISDLNEDKVLLRNKLYALEEEKRELQDRIRKLKSDIKSHHDLTTERDALKQSLSKIRTEYESYKQRHSLDRKNADNQAKDIEDEKDKLRKELNILKTEKQKLAQEKDQLMQRIHSEKETFKLEHDKLKTEKMDLINLLKERESHYKDKIDDLEVEINILHDREKKETEKRSENMSMKVVEEIRTLMEEKNQAITDLYAIKKERDTMIKEIYDLKSDLKRVETETKTYEDDAKDYQSKISSLTREKTKQEEQYNCLLKENIQSNDELSAMRKEQSELHIKIENLKSESRKLQMERERDISFFETESKKDKEKMTKLEMEIQDLHARLSTGITSKTQYESLTAKYVEEKKSIREELRKTNNELNETRKERDTLQSEIDNLRSKLEISVIDNQKFEKKSKEHHDTINKLKLENTRYDEERKRLRYERDQARHDLSQMRQEQNDLQSKNDALRSQLQQLNNDLERHNSFVQSETKQDKQLINQLERDIADLRVSLNEERQQYKSLQKAHGDQMKKNDIQNANYEALVSQFNDLDLEKQNIGHECRKHYNNANALQSKIDSLNERNVQYETDLHAKDMKVDDLTAELEGQQQQCKVLSQVLEGIKKEKTDLENQLQVQSSNSGEIISFKRQVNNLLSENGDLKQRCQYKDELQQKTDNEIRNLKGRISQLETDSISLKQEKDSLSAKLETERVAKAELEERARRRSPQVTDPKNCQNCWKHRNEISDLRREVNDLRDRLSEAAGNRLRDNNPNIADLSDMNRPTSLAEKFNSLYTDEYTDAMEVVDGEMEEEVAVNLLLEWLKTCYEWCARIAKEQRNLLIRDSAGFVSKYNGQQGQFALTDRCHIYAKEFQKKIASDTLPAVQQICQIKSVTQEKLRRNEYIVKYIKRCTELCWMMQITDPPLYVNFDVSQGERLEKDLYNVFTKSGSKIRYLVWPVLYLHEGGPLLAKGVAQGM